MKYVIWHNKTFSTHLNKWHWENYTDKKYIEEIKAEMSKQN